MNAASPRSGRAGRPDGWSRLAAVGLCAGLFAGCPPHKPTPIAKSADHSYSHSDLLRIQAEPPAPTR